MMYREGRKFAGACPRCLEPLLAHADSKNVRTCAKCGGVFANVEASRRIVSTLDRSLLAISFEARLGKGEPPKDRGGPVSCPECLVEMHKVRVESAVCDVDACPTHGTWFDPGELEAVMRAYAAYRRRGGHIAPDRPPRPDDFPHGEAEKTQDDPVAALLALVSDAVRG